MKDTILVTGDKGYIGTVLTSLLLKDGYLVKGIDSNYFNDCNLTLINKEYPQIKKDIRDINISDLENVDSIIHLAGLSNDPLGELMPGLTEQINRDACINLAKLAKKVGVQRFIYASSQSMYGISKFDEELDEDNSAKNPITSYAKTKWEAELEIKRLADEKFTVVCFRPSTVFGVSPRLRSDIVFNNLVACAYTTGKIEIKSDGTPWRPVVHIKDVCNAFMAGLRAPRSLINGRSYNVGIKDGNYTVRDLAEAASYSVPGSELIFTGEHGKDSRTYKVSFKRILTELNQWYKPKWDLKSGGRELVEFFKKIKFNEQDFRSMKTNRLLKLKFLKESGLISDKLRWQKHT